MAVKTLRNIIRHGAEAYEEQTVFRYKIKKEITGKTYNEVNLDPMAVSRAVETLGMKGKHIVVIGTTSYQWITTYPGIVNSGSVVVPIDVQLPAEAVCELSNRADVEILVYDELRSNVVDVVCGRCPGIRHVVFMQVREAMGDVLSLSRLVAGHAGTYETGFAGGQLCTMPPTSGTTGKSKGVMLSRRNLMDNAVYLDMRISTGTVSMTLLPTSHVYCLTMDIIERLYIGMIICINDFIMHVQRNMKLFKPETVLLVLLIIESIYGKLEDAGNLILRKMVAKATFGGSLRVICSGGVYLDPDYVDRFREYGTTILQSCGTTGCSSAISTSLERENKKSSAGKLPLSYEARVVDEEI